MQPDNHIEKYIQGVFLTGPPPKIFSRLAPPKIASTAVLNANAGPQTGPPPIEKVLSTEPVPSQS